MALFVHELRHAGQYYSTFESEQIRGVSLGCESITGRVAEVDAWLNMNHWMIHSSISPNDFVYTQEDYYNGGNLFTVDSLWENELIMNYMGRYGTRFDSPTPFRCP